MMKHTDSPESVLMGGGAGASGNASVEGQPHGLGPSSAAGGGGDTGFGPRDPFIRRALISRTRPSIKRYLQHSPLSRALTSQLLSSGQLGRSIHCYAMPRFHAHQPELGLVVVCLVLSSRAMLWNVACQGCAWKSRMLLCHAGVIGRAVATPGRRACKCPARRRGSSNSAACRTSLGSTTSRWQTCPPATCGSLGEGASPTSPSKAPSATTAATTPSGRTQQTWQVCPSQPQAIPLFTPTATVTGRSGRLNPDTSRRADLARMYLCQRATHPPVCL